MSDNIFRDFVKDIPEYKPGKNPDKPGVIKLASNENPFGPSPKALEAISKEAKLLQRYPDQKSTLLRQALANKLKVDEKCIICGNGSDDVMQIAGAAFIAPQDEVIISKNSFSVYELVARTFEGIPVFVGLKNHQSDLSAIAAAVTKKTKMIFLTNPHNPTGAYLNQLSLDSFLKIIPDNVLVVIDEAYCEFAQAQDFPKTIKYIQDGRNNILILRTFSKYFGLAGLRVGYGITSKGLAQAMMKVKMPFNVNRLAQAGALAALDDKSFLEKTYKSNLDGKIQLYRAFDALGLSYIKTEANFIFVDIKKNTDEFFLQMMSLGIIIRPLTSFGFPEAIRVSVGTKDQNNKFIDALKKVL